MCVSETRAGDDCSCGGPTSFLNISLTIMSMIAPTNGCKNQAFVRSLKNKSIGKSRCEAAPCILRLNFHGWQSLTRITPEQFPAPGFIAVGPWEVSVLQ